MSKKLNYAYCDNVVLSEVEKNRANEFSSMVIGSYIKNVKKYKTLTEGSPEKVIIRKLEYIDSAIISMMIKDNLEQSLEELAIRLAIACLYTYEDVYEYITNRTLFYYAPTVDHMVANGNSLATMVKWTPGEYTSVYNEYCAIKKVMR